MIGWGQAAVLLLSLLGAMAVGFLVAVLPKRALAVMGLSLAGAVSFVFVYDAAIDGIYLTRQMPPVVDHRSPLQPAAQKPQPEQALSPPPTAQPGGDDRPAETLPELVAALADHLPPEVSATALPPVPNATESEEIPAGEEEIDRGLIQYLLIPSLKVDARVVAKPLKDGTWKIDGLRDNVALLEGTSLPGLGGNTVLAGHIMVRYIGDGPFRYLSRLTPGAQVIALTAENAYTYRVREQQLVGVEDVGVTGPSENSQLTLLTCSNWDDQTESYLRRRVVVADLVKVVPLSEYGF
jgi:LPXTG-site transpeptidase (sortase) family protein